ncbi:hypothetical protein ACO1O0_003438 [Amphichorda felina]
MPLTLELPDQYGFILAIASSTFLVNFLHTGLTSKYRKASGVSYPNAYASHELATKDKNAYRFNCAQRAHANFIENQPSFLGALAISGLRYPFAASILGATWVVGRIIYALGYTSSAGPKGRVFGSVVSTLADLSLRLAAVYTSVMYVLAQ